MVKFRLNKTHIKVINELKAGAYILSDGVTCSFGNSEMIVRYLTFHYLLKSGVLVKQDHASKAFSEKKYVLIPDFDSKISINRFQNTIFKK